MTLLLERPAPPRPAPGGTPRPGYLARRRQRGEADLVRAALERGAALARVGACLERAAPLLAQGWVQDRWYVVDLPRGRRGIGPLDLPLLGRGPLVGACLVGAAVQAAGEDPRAASVARRTVDVLWEVLEEPSRPDLPEFRRVCPPQERAARVRDLTRWNDAPERSRAEVLGLVEAARTRALAAAARC